MKYAGLCLCNLCSRGLCLAAALASSFPVCMSNFTVSGIWLWVWQACKRGLHTVHQAMNSTFETKLATC